jgi:xanthine dehydrogenase accessory factor
MTESTLPQLLILGKGEIARCLARLARAMTWPVTVVELGLDGAQWPDGVVLKQKGYTEAPWPLPPHTHAVVARGHEGDAESVTALLDQGAARVYLIASARRAVSVMAAARPLLREAADLARLSAPAGLALGGRDSAEIALAIVAEIQLVHRGGSGTPLHELREQRASLVPTPPSADGCPGQRP